MLAVCVIAIAGVSGVFGTLNGFSVLPAQTNGVSGSAPLEGHVTVVATHPDGNVYAYRQTDNLVTNVGKTCVGVLVFGVAGNSTTDGGGAVSTHCQATSVGKFQFIGIGTDTTTAAVEQTHLGKEIEARQQDATPGVTNATGTGASSTLVGIGIINAAFTTTANSTAQSIGEAGLFDATRNGGGVTSSLSGHMFARQVISPAIGVNTGDTLNIKWTISLG